MNITYPWGTLGKLQILNNEGRIYADTPLWGLELTQDTVIAATEVVVNGRGNGHKLTIEGDFLLGPNFILNDGALLHIKGDLRVQEVTGELPVGLESSGMAQVIVDKDLRVQKKDENGNYGEISGGLFMDVTGQLKIVVKGDFYCQSTSSRAQIHEGVILELHGDFNLLGKYSVFSSTKGRVVFAGDSEQHIFMESVWGELKNITQNKSCPSLVFNCSDGTVTLAGDIIIKNSSNIHKLGLNGNTADIQGSANITGSIGGGSLKCSGDLTVTGVLSPYKGILNIGGDLYLEDEGKINMSYDEGIIVINGTLYNLSLIHI